MNELLLKLCILINDVGAIMNEKSTKSIIALSYGCVSALSVWGPVAAAAVLWTKQITFDARLIPSNACRDAARTKLRHKRNICLCFTLPLTKLKGQLGSITAWIMGRAALLRSGRCRPGNARAESKLDPSTRLNPKR